MLDQLNDRELRELAAILKNGLKVTRVSNEVKVKVADWIMWVEWRCGIDGRQEVDDLLLFKGVEHGKCDIQNM